jgi:hypothetical protein
MPLFTSKLQHKTYEKGEFSDEQQRSLEETIALIKTFPWDEERPLTDVQLTGPSVTIKNEEEECLKIGLYFNGKFCLYFLDKGNHVYEYHAPDIDTACGLVSDYVNGVLDLQKFDKHLLDIGANKHFENKNFDYKVNHTHFYWSFSAIMALMLFMVPLILLIIIKRAPIFLSIFFIFSTLLMFTLPYTALKTYSKSKNMFIHLSKGNDVFQFGDNDAINNYNKADIKVISISNVSKNDKSAIYDIIFKDGNSIRFPGLLIPYFDFINKFPGIDIEYVRNKWPVSF